MDQNKTPKGRRLLSLAEGMPCIRCGVEDGTVCARHYTGPRQHSFGKGRSVKLHPIATVEFCQACDAEFSEGVMPPGCETKWEKSEEWLFWVTMTNIRRFDDDIL